MQSSTIEAWYLEQAMTMNEFIIQNETSIRMGFFGGMLLVMALWEMMAPRKALTVSRLVRWVNNLGIVVLNSIAIRFIFPLAAAAIAAYSSSHGWGVFNIVDVPAWLAILLTVILLDLVIYLQHVAVHAIPVLWRLHHVHHADPDIDVTTGARFHTLEIIFSMLIKIGVIIALGVPVVAVIIFEVLLNATAMFNHSNVRMPVKFDKVLRWFVVTPDMHRVHHSVRTNETNSNFGFNLPWWDRLFGTYIAQPADGHIKMVIGSQNFREPKQVSWIPGMLMLPFAARPINSDYNLSQWFSPFLKRFTRIVLLSFIVGGITAVIVFRDQLNVEALGQWVQNAGAAGPVIFMLIYVVATVLFFPGALLTLAGGALFGPVAGSLYNLFAATIGATISFLVTRFLAADWVEQKAHGRIKQLKEGVEKEGWHFIAFVRLVPLIPFNILNYALGLTKISTWQYIIASFIFMIPGAVAYTYLGYVGREAVAGGEGLVQKIMLAIALLAVAGFLPRIVKRLRNKKL